MNAEMPVTFDGVKGGLSCRSDDPAMICVIMITACPDPLPSQNPVGPLQSPAQ